MLQRGRREEMRGSLLKRVKESHETKDSWGTGGSYLVSDREFIQWKCSEHKHYIDIIPYVVGSTHPKLSAGEVAYNLDFWAHFRIGPMEVQIICLARTFGSSCPVCEARKALIDSGSAYDDEAVAPLQSKRRTLYNVWVHDDQKEQDKGVQVWDVAHFFMEKNLVAIAERPRGGGFVPFADPDIGKQIMFEREGTGATNTRFIGHQFIDRDYQIPDEILEMAQPLDELLVISTYQEVQILLQGGTAPSREAEVEPVEERAAVGERVGRFGMAGLAGRGETAPTRLMAHEETACPLGGKFGSDFQQLDGCEVCEKFDGCSDEAERLSKKPAPSRRPEPAKEPARPGPGLLRRPSARRS